MKSRLRTVLSLGGAMFAGAFGCSSTDSGAVAAAGAAGLAATAGAGTAAAGLSNASAGGDSAGASGGGSECVRLPISRRTQGTVISLSIVPEFANQPFVFGQPNSLSSGGSLVPLNFRFYISELQLLPSSGPAIAVDLVNAAGEPEAYGVHLFNAEDEQTSRVRVLAPPGEYAGLSFALGLKLGCNQQSPAQLGEPLTDFSQMTWPHTGGFLFLRYEGRYTAADGSSLAPSDMPPAVHMGGNITKELVPRVTAQAVFTAPATGVLEKDLRVQVDELFAGATSDIDVSDAAVGFLSSPEAVAGERLRRKLPELRAFLLEP